MQMTRNGLQRLKYHKLCPPSLIKLNDLLTLFGI